MFSWTLVSDAPIVVAVPKISIMHPAALQGHLLQTSKMTLVITVPPSVKKQLGQKNGKTDWSKSKNFAFRYFSMQNDPAAKPQQQTVKVKLLHFIFSSFTLHNRSKGKRFGEKRLQMGIKSMNRVKLSNQNCKLQLLGKAIPNC